MKYLDIAVASAISNPVKRPLPKIATILTNYKGRVFIGLNSRKTHPLQKRFGITHHCIHLHAEIDAIWRAVRAVGADLSDFDMYVARVHRDGSKALAKPCEGCLGAISVFNINNVHWTE